MAHQPKEHRQLVALIEDAKVFTELTCVNAEEGQVDAGAACRYARAALVFTTMAVESFLNFILSVHPDPLRPKESESFRTKLRWQLSTLPKRNEEPYKKEYDDLFDAISSTYALRNALVHYTGEVESHSTPLYLAGELRPENVVRAFVALRDLFHITYPEIAHNDPVMRSILRLHRYEVGEEEAG